MRLSASNAVLAKEGTGQQFRPTSRVLCRVSDERGAFHSGATVPVRLDKCRDGLVLALIEALAELRVLADVAGRRHDTGTEVGARGAGDCFAGVT